MSGPLPRQTARPSGTRDKVNKSGAVPEIPGHLEAMTQWHRLSEMDIPLSSYIDNSDSDLDAVMSLLVSRFPQNGIVMLWGHLKSINIFVTRQNVAESISSISSLSTITFSISECLRCASSKLLTAY